jgi:riboflavin biosynthesis pyrimidine reductase
MRTDASTGAHEPLAPLAMLYDSASGDVIPLPPPLAPLYGAFRLPTHANRPHVVGNFVTTLDGVVTLNSPGYEGGGPISGFNPHDRLVMGLLRAVADAVVMGAGTLRSVPDHRWTADDIYPALAETFQTLRTGLGKPQPPLNVIVTARGVLDLRLPVFQSGDVPVLIVTTTEGLGRIPTRALPAWVRAVEAGDGREVSTLAVLAAVRQAQPCTTILVEGGPRLMGNFFAERVLDELFLTLAPQVAGRDGRNERPGLVAGQRFAPEHSIWGTLVDVRQAASHLFLRYAFDWTTEPAAVTEPVGKEI